MDNLLLLLMILPLLGGLFILTSRKNDNNAFHVTLYTLATGIALILRLLSFVIKTVENSMAQYKYAWLSAAKVEIIFGADTFSLLMLLGVYLSCLIGVVGLQPVQRKNNSLLFLLICFVWAISGFFVAQDMISLYFFFAAMLIPLFMLVGIFGDIKKISTLYLYFAVNLIGTLLLLTATIVIYRQHLGNISFADIAAIKMPHRIAIVLWASICLAFLSRIPIWPFHYWLSLICTGLKNPLVYIATNLTILTGIYGFVRFWERTIPESMEAFLPIMETFGVMTMLFVALIGISFREFLPKLFSYSAVYYLLFMLVIILLPIQYAKNISYSLFIFLIVNATLAVLELWSENTRQESGCDYRGILAYMPKLTWIFTFFVLVAVGLPISSMFWSNFILISALFRENFTIGIGIMTAITFISMALVHELFMMRNLPSKCVPETEIEDISDRKAAFFTGIIILIFLSFFNPLWFVF